MPREPVSAARLTVIGDSLTFGFGAKPAEAYPPRLQERLATQPAWSVVNAGIPGQNSADVVTRLADLLPKLRPEAVCLLVGAIDDWRGGIPAVVPAAGGWVLGRGRAPECLIAAFAAVGMASAWLVERVMWVPAILLPISAVLQWLAI